MVKRGDRRVKQIGEGGLLIAISLDVDVGKTLQWENQRCS